MNERKYELSKTDVEPRTALHVHLRIQVSYNLLHFCKEKVCYTILITVNRKRYNFVFN